MGKISAINNPVQALKDITPTHSLPTLFIAYSRGRSWNHKCKRLIKFNSEQWTGIKTCFYARPSI